MDGMHACSALGSCCVSCAATTLLAQPLRSPRADPADPSTRPNQYLSPPSIGAPTLFATHFHELTDISGPGGVANLHVGTRIEADTGARHADPCLLCRRRC
jgi:hypothetical protein